MVNRAVRMLLNLCVALNMLVCAVVFAPWAEPRETVSGLVARWATREIGWKQTFGIVASAAVDALYFWERDHCYVRYLRETNARLDLYPRTLRW